MKWGIEADRVLRVTLKALPDDATFADAQAACKAAYPFGERAMHPYKIWLKKQKAWLLMWALRKGLINTRQFQHGEFPEVAK